MKTKVILAAVALMFAGIVVKAQNPHMGTWKLNEAKSHFAPGATKNNTVVYEAAGTDTKVMVDGTDKDGNAVHNEWTGKFNGTYYDVQGSPTSNKRAYRKINSRTLTITEKQGNKIVLTGTITVSANGKSRTVRTSATGANGKRMRNTAVYDKQP